MLFGHSLGGLIVMSYVFEDRAAPDYLIASAPGLDVEISPLKKAAARLLSRVAPKLLIPNDIVYPV